MKLSELIIELTAIQKQLAESGNGDIDVVSGLDSNCTFVQGNVDDGIDFTHSGDCIILVSYLSENEDLILTNTEDSAVIE